MTPKQLLEASLRLRPDRILLAELRGEEAYYFLRNVSSGHPGSITSIHAGSAALAFEQLALLIKESPPGREMALTDIHRLLHAVVDVVVHCSRDGASRRVSEVWWRDAPATPRGSNHRLVRRPPHADRVCTHGEESMLSLRPNCECCDRDLGADSSEAYICSFECTFCRVCAEGTLHGVCPNCGGELVRRPRRPESLLAKYPASADRIVKSGGCRPGA